MGFDEHAQPRARSARPTFTDRDGERELFGRALAAATAAGPEHPRIVDEMRGERRNIVVFYGQGGVGKTTLKDDLRRAVADARASDRRASVAVDLDFKHADKHATELLALQLRSQVGALPGARFEAFDLVFGLYWARAHPNRALESVFHDEGPLSRFGYRYGVPTAIRDSLSVALTALGAPGVGSSAAKLLELGGKPFLRRLSNRRLAACRLLSDALDAGEPSEMASYLPWLLAWDVARYQAEHHTAAVVFCDHWEYVQEDVGIHRAESKVEEFFRRVVYSMPNLVFVVFGRSPLGWANPGKGLRGRYLGSAVWPTLVLGVADCAQHRLGNLSADDSLTYLDARLPAASFPEVSTVVRARIAAESEGLPLYLDIEVERCEQLIEAGQALAPADFGGPLPEVVARLMDDLDRDQQRLLRAASLVRHFDAGLLRRVVPDTAAGDRDRFLWHSFVRRREQSDAWLGYSLNDRLRESVRQADRDRAVRHFWSDAEWTEAAGRAAEFLRSAVAGSDPLSAGGVVAESFVEGLALASGFDLADVDYLAPLADALNVLGRQDVLEQALRLAAGRGGRPAWLFARAVDVAVLRSRGEDARAWAIAAGLDTRDLPAGAAEEYIAFQKAVTAQSSSRFAEAERGFRAVVDRGGAHAERSAWELARLELARADFSSLAAVEAMARADDQHLRMHGLVELGSIHRTHGSFAHAEACFTQTREIAESLGSTKWVANAWVYRAETACWADPDRGRAYSELAIAANQNGSRLIVLAARLARTVAEIGKADLASLARGITACTDEYVELGSGFRLARPLFAALAVHAAHGSYDGFTAAARGIEDLERDFGRGGELLAIAGRWARDAFGADEPVHPPVRWAALGREHPLEVWSAVLAAKRAAVGS